MWVLTSMNIFFSKADWVKKKILCGTLLPVPPGWMKRCWRSRNEGEMKRFFCCDSCFVFVVGLLFVSFLFGSCFASTFVLLIAYLESFPYVGCVWQGWGGIGRTRKWIELGCMMWNLQRVNKEVILKKKSFVEAEMAQRLRAEVMSSTSRKHMVAPDHL